MKAVLILALALLAAGCQPDTRRGPAAPVVGQVFRGPCFGNAPCYNPRGELVDHLGRRFPGQERKR